MVLHDIGRIGTEHRGAETEDRIARYRKRRRQAIALVVCAAVSWGLIALLFYGVELTGLF